MSRLKYLFECPGYLRKREMALTNGDCSGRLISYAGEMKDENL